MIRTRHRRSLRSGAVGVAAAAGLLVVSCTSGDSSSEPPDDVEVTGWEVVEEDGTVVADTGAAVLSVGLDPFSVDATFAEEHEPFFVEEAGLYLARGDTRTGIERATGFSAGERSVDFDVVFDDGSTGTVGLAADGRADSVGLTLRPDDDAGFTAWGERLASPDDELIYGLTERITDSYEDSELYPAAVGSLNRRGETVEMWITPTISGYAPFHQSSKGYGLLVDGFMPGRYDIAATDPGIVAFEFEWDPDADAATYHLFAGPDHSTIVSAYHDLTGHPPQPPDHVFRHWRGYDVHPIGETTTVDGVEINAAAARDLDVYEEYDIPAGLYRFDRPWTVGEAGFAEWEFDPERFPNAEEMLEIFEGRGWKMHVFTAPWALGSLGDEAERLGYLAPNSDRDAASEIVGVSVDFTNPDAVEWYKTNVLEFLAGPEGRHIDGFVMDRGDESDVSSGVDDIWFDGRNGRQVHNWYPVAYDRIYREIIEEARPDDGYLLARAGYTGSQAYVMRWGGDTHGRDGFAIPEVELTAEQSPSTDKGLRSVLISVQRAAFMGTPFWGSDIGGYNGWLDREVYARWIEVGFASPIMRFHGRDGTPWNTPPDGAVDEELMDIYRGYIRLRHDMNDYLARTARVAAEDGTPMVRPLVFEWPDEESALDRWDEWMLGDDLLVAPVWESGARERTVWIPPGEWIDFWDREAMVEGPTEITVDVPLGRLPMWVRPDSELLDLDVDGALLGRAVSAP
ncbi:MAG: glycoside hydrolase family 31 protein [Acidimicrobiia bacterium]